eukprot:TRINITY_DN2234_c1_g1_i1.p1 TRINITY_DN2234_c1_g1~~TRINITY_DN2234_c1_g1_i1.p1  ORF type:complete len:292 (+),score=62.98 TRINITY_DN2234_c1_g1_i1:146-1021(+)
MSDDGSGGGGGRCSNMTLSKAVTYYTWFVRGLVILLSLVLIFFFGLSMERECESSKLNFVGKMFSVISYMGYIVMSAVVFIVQLEIKFFLKYLNMLHYWPAKAAMQIFLGVQTLNAKENLETAGMSSDTQKIVADIAGWILVVTGLSLFALSLLQMNKSDLSAYANVAADSLSRNAKKLKEKADQGMKSDNHHNTHSEPMSPPLSTALLNQEEPLRQLDEEEDTSGAFPFNVNTSERAPRKTDVSEPYNPPAATIDEDINARRQREDDELEKMYANAIGATSKPTTFDAAD